jgi:hypothetical protein
MYERLFVHTSPIERLTFAFLCGRSTPRRAKNIQQVYLKRSYIPYASLEGIAVKGHACPGFVYLGSPKVEGLVGYELTKQPVGVVRRQTYSDTGRGW